jgi:hypothetical protein
MTAATSSISRAGSWSARYPLAPRPRRSIRTGATSADTPISAAASPAHVDRSLKAPPISRIGRPFPLGSYAMEVPSAEAVTVAVVMGSSWAERCVFSPVGRSRPLLLDIGLDETKH